MNTINGKEGNEIFRGTEKEVILYYRNYIEGNVSSLDRWIGDTKDDNEHSVYEICGNNLECVAKRSWN